LPQSRAIDRWAVPAGTWEAVARRIMGNGVLSGGTCIRRLTRLLLHAPKLIATVALVSKGVFRGTRTDLRLGPGVTLCDGHSAAHRCWHPFEDV